MTDEVLGKIISEAAILGEKITFIWHGGEPLLAGLDFFQRAIKLQEDYFGDRKRVNSIQTNATLVTEEWAEFLTDHDFAISTSIDGPRALHNQARSNSFDGVIRGAKLIKGFTKKKLGALITVHKYNVNFPDLIWESIIRPREFADKFDVSIVAKTENSDLAPTIDESFDFLKRLFFLWMQEDNPDIEIRFFMSVLRSLKGGKSRLCALEYGKCGDYVSIDNLGDVYFCNRLMKRDVAYVGSILQDSLSDLLKRKRNLYDKMVLLRADCRSCEWLSSCGGGCPYYKWASTGDFNGRDPECFLKKRFFHYVKTEFLS